jgi:hypothetical protein
VLVEAGVEHIQGAHRSLRRLSKLGDVQRRRNEIKSPVADNSRAVYMKRPEKWKNSLRGYSVMLPRKSWSVSIKRTMK